MRSEARAKGRPPQGCRTPAHCSRPQGLGGPPCLPWGRVSVPATVLAVLRQPPPCSRAEAAGTRPVHSRACAAGSLNHTSVTSVTVGLHACPARCDLRCPQVGQGTLAGCAEEGRPVGSCLLWQCHPAHGAARASRGGCSGSRAVSDAGPQADTAASPSVPVAEAQQDHSCVHPSPGARCVSSRPGLLSREGSGHTEQMSSSL